LSHPWVIIKSKKGEIGLMKEINETRLTKQRYEKYQRNLKALVIEMQRRGEKRRSLKYL
jgi:hypothetical protein